VVTPRAAKASEPRETRGEVNVFLQGAPQPVLFISVEFSECHEIAVKHIPGFGTQHISQPAGHARTEIEPSGPRMMATPPVMYSQPCWPTTFHYGKRTAISDGETLSGAAGNKELARSGAVKHGVAGKNVNPRLEAPSPAAMAMVPPDSPFPT